MFCVVFSLLLLWHAYYYTKYRLLCDGFIHCTPHINLSEKCVMNWKWNMCEHKWKVTTSLWQKNREKTYTFFYAKINLNEYDFYICYDHCIVADCGEWICEQWRYQSSDQSGKNRMFQIDSKLLPYLFRSHHNFKLIFILRCAYHLL